MELTSINVIILSEAKKYKIARIGIDISKEELFYHFLSVHRKNILSRVGEDNSIYSDATPDHISFHGDGNIHIRYKKQLNNKKKDVIQNGKINIFHPSDNDMVQSILMHTLYFQKEDYKEPTAEELKMSIILDILKRNVFSVILFLKHKSINPDAFMKKYDFYRKLKIKPPCYYFDVANDFHICLFLSACENRVDNQLHIANKTLAGC